MRERLRRCLSRRLSELPANLCWHLRKRDVLLRVTLHRRGSRACCRAHHSRRPPRLQILRTIGRAIRLRRRIWDYVSHSELGSLWNCEGTPIRVVLKRTAKAFMDDDLPSRAAELGFYFLFSLFPMLICVSSVLGLAARSASSFYDSLLHSLAVVVPPSAYRLVIDTFNQTAQASSGGKALLGSW